MLLTLDEALADRERQDSEFKQSTAEANAAAQALVGFANSRGGQVFFGVTDNRRAIGIETGGKVIEDLASKLDQHIYPSLPLEFDTFPGEGTKQVVRVWTPADKPPIVGGYLYSAWPIGLDDGVEVAKTTAYRRVGRQTRKVDFMWLRGVLSTDPLVIIDAGDGSQVQNDQLVIPWTVWHASGGVAFELLIVTESMLGPVVGPIKDLPGASATRTGGNVGINLAELRQSVLLEPFAGGFSGRQLEAEVGHLWLVVRYRDEWGSTWESRRRVAVLVEPSREFTIANKESFMVPRAQAASTAEFQRRIVSLPPKRLASPK